MIEWIRRGFRNSYVTTIGGQTFVISGNTDGDWDACMLKPNDHIIGIGFAFNTRHDAAAACVRTAGLDSGTSVFVE